LTSAVLAALLVFALSSAHGGRTPGSFEVGVRVGVFANDENELAVQDSPVELFGNKRNIYAEGFAAYYLLEPLAAVVNLGSYAKGDIRFEAQDVFGGRYTFFGSASIYPIQLGLRLSPFARQLPAAISPYIEAGGALIVGRESIGQLYYDQFSDAFIDGTIGTETDWNWWAAAGAEIPVATKFNLDFMFKYIRTEFSGDIAGIRDYSGWQITIGVGYFAVLK
jgi:hypothetical protein